MSPIKLDFQCDFKDMVYWYKERGEGRGTIKKKRTFNLFSLQEAETKKLEISNI